MERSTRPVSKAPSRGAPEHSSDIPTTMSFPLIHQLLSTDREHRLLFAARYPLVARPRDRDGNLFLFSLCRKRILRKSQSLRQNFPARIIECIQKGYSGTIPHVAVMNRLDRAAKNISA